MHFDTSLGGCTVQVTDVALRDFPPDILAEAIPFLKFYETRPLSKFLLEVLEETFESIPVSSSSKGAGSPAKVRILVAFEKFFSFRCIACFHICLRSKHLRLPRVNAVPLLCRWGT